MNRLVLLSLLAFALILLGLGTLQGQLLALAVVFVVFLFSGLIFSPEKPNLKAQRELSSRRVSLNTPITVHLSLTNQGHKLEQVWCEDDLPENLEFLDGKKSLLAYLAPGDTARVEYTIQARRGAYEFRDLEVWTSDHLGIVRNHTRLHVLSSFAVLPEALRLPSIPIRPQQTREYPGIIPARKGGPGTDFYGIRDYQPGDTIRQINWHASARHPQELYSNQFELERAADISLILDARQNSYLAADGDSLFEHAVLATASLAQTFLRDGNRVGLVHYGQYIGWTFPGYGKMQRERILYALAQAQPGESQIDHLEYLPTRFFKPRSQVVLISPLQIKDLDTLLHFRARGYAVMLISPDPISFEVLHLPDNDAVRLATRIAEMERLVLISQLQQAGVRVLNWNVSVPFDQAIFTLTRGRARFGR